MNGSESGYPTDYEYEAGKKTLRVGDGTFAPVETAVWEFEVSGMHVLRSWLDYRMKNGAGRKSSPLDDIRPRVWSAEFTEELLRVIWILERTTELGAQLDKLLDEVIDGDTFDASSLPAPDDSQRQAPK
ncbi:MAG: hypothetical protein HY827_01520 [Actinobacteria bacterium]|nr:hypothetical protein [Actinomycetota bacterium]